MSKNIFNSIRIIPRDSDFLDRKTGSRGEVFFDRVSNSLRLFDGIQPGGIDLAKADLSNVPDSALLEKLEDLDIGGSGGNAFASVAVAGNMSVIADSAQDTLTLVAGSNITITTDPITDSVTISSTASSNSEVLGIVAGTNVTVTVNQGIYTINSAGTVNDPTGNLTFDENTIDISSGESIIFVPDVVLQSDLVFSDGSRQNTATLQGTDGIGIIEITLDDDNLVVTLTDSTVINLGSIVGPEGPPGPSGDGSGDVTTTEVPVTNRAIVRYSGTSGTNIQNSLASVSDTGTVTAPAFSGNGSLINSLNADSLSSGTLPDARFPATLPATSGINLTALNATNLGSGTVPVARLGTSGTRDATTFLRGDNTWATVSVEGGAASNSFATITVAGQSNVAADNSTDTLTLVAGTGVSITTDASTDTITFTNSSPNISQNVFSTIAVEGQSNVVADSSTDTLTLVAGSGIALTTDAGTDTVTITSTVASGVTAFTGLSDSASATIDQIYLPAITSLTVSNSGASAYLFDQYAGNNPTIYAISGTTIAFKLNVSGHPFLIQDGTGSNYNTGLIHVTTTGTVTTGASAQGKTSGTLYWKVPADISGGYRYQCSVHGPMVGSVTVKSFATL